jgi:acetyl-CoA carboxylase biotin carboxylase subunit
MEKVLIANRGEIALRIMRSLKEMGIQTVAVFSDADRLAPFVKMADEAVHLGPAPSHESYLKSDLILEQAKTLGVDGIHPGYGFLSENPDFARQVEEAGLSFIGPDGRAIEIMGDKLAAKAAVQQYDIPLLPGTDEPMEDLSAAQEVADNIGYPVLIKAAAGGGGKGMRIVEQQADMAEQFERAVSEASSAFGNGAVFIEKYVASPRHVEVQVLGDQRGNYVYLHERECSIQRRHQKVIEEAPSSIITPELRQQMGEAAIGVARSCGYVGAGTVELLVDEEKNFYFLEMNTRLQVEHPITEMITGIDLVKEQIRVARGEELGYSQESIPLNGHAIELRVYAEDPENNFLPAIGTLTTYRPPDGFGIRTDSGYEEGQKIPVEYDPMIAKLVAHDTDRQRAIDKLSRAIDDFQLAGVDSTLAFGKYTIQHPQFRSGDYDTHFVSQHFTGARIHKEHDDEASVASLIAVRMKEEQRQKAKQQMQIAQNNGEQWRARKG